MPLFSLSLSLPEVGVFVFVLVFVRGQEHELYTREELVRFRRVKLSFGVGSHGCN